MHTIEIDDQVLNELSRQATGFHVTPNDVLRKLLQLDARPAAPTSPSAPNGAASSSTLPATLAEFLRSERFRRHYQAVDKFLAILGWLHHMQPKQFSEVALAFRRGS